MDKKKLLTLIWIGDIFTKPIYLFIAWQQYNAGLMEPEIIPMISYIFLGVGIAAAIGGILVIRELSKRDSALFSLYSRFYSQSPGGTGGDPLFGLYTVGLGLVETSSLFALVSYLSTGALRPSLIMVGVWFVAWFFSRPVISE
ncbi:hypothetical protein [Spirochaeta isovalerica]|uniref:F0F1-type ATP synthase membrane subunit c/vacuolar-type H+-ATPase subunit K n=1 Tax=Spirochaeta isovalerica TaxID=150 RepID=A0A841RAP6_9SPIO|nr:hypothetical protein [Spirochaeta isovalerica]MBB6480431.1 F0F1-type ATP synthase membrane subunit c/vacuolar-type H+-ATPase subunit K [Spirochaeta isovalerica]